ncbi:hypothetical protein [Streptomyces maremycinicus]|uniref:hypothetical protein n=1 Tax=Streptomyces maremycinicus TaxID=1679753 RepID=UPI000789926F|nr:hypothetical protein [Streptomyces sp. NBRC 110468]
MTGFAPTGRVLVSPVYLAGPGNSTMHLITATADAFSRPDPARRRPRDLPERHLPFVTIRSAAARTQAHAAGATARPSASAVPVARTPAHLRLANPTRSRR